MGTRHFVLSPNGRNTLNDACFGPNALPAGAAPLGPVRSGHYGRNNKEFKENRERPTHVANASKTASC